MVPVKSGGRPALFAGIRLDHMAAADAVAENDMGSPFLRVLTEPFLAGLIH